jgi:hypothetical protein
MKNRRDKATIYRLSEAERDALKRSALDVRESRFASPEDVAFVFRKRAKSD